MKFTRLLIIKFALLTPFFSNPLGAAPDKLFIDLVNYSASIDGLTILTPKEHFFF